jgi:hypothetical protein
MISSILSISENWLGSRQIRYSVFDTETDDNGRANLSNTSLGH